MALDAVLRKFKGESVTPVTPVILPDVTPEATCLLAVTPVTCVTPENREHKHGLTLAELKEAAGEDWPDIEHDSKAMEAMAKALKLQRMRERGEIPPHYTATTICKHFGPVPIFPGCPETVLGCPWCFNRMKGLPVPNRREGYEKS